MTRGVVLCFVGSGLVVALSGCGSGWLEQRAPWRHDAEVACLSAGAVKEGPAIVALRPIDGPGLCGADFPLRVSALGTTATLSLADEREPSGLIARPTSPQGVPAAYALASSIGPSQGPMTSEPVRGLALPPSAAALLSSGPSQAALTAPAQPDAPAGLAPGRLGAPGPAALTPPATLACPVTAALDAWLSAGIQPAAMRWFGQPVIEIKQMSAYSCRPMNGQIGAPISEHAFGNALDIAGFTLADRRAVTVRGGWSGLPDERGFLHDVQATACQLFSTVLAPGANAFHTDHIHVDLARHASGRRVCRPAPGDLTARGGDPPSTGTLATGTLAGPAMRSRHSGERLEDPDED